MRTNKQAAVRKVGRRCPQRAGVRHSPIPCVSPIRGALRTPSPYPPKAVHGVKARITIPGILTLACLLVAVPATAQVNYNISAIGSVVTRSPNASGDIVIATTYLGDTVTWIVGCAFCGCTNLTSVAIPYGVMRLGSPSPVFSGCTSLTNISVDPANTNFSSLDGVVFNKAQTTLITFPPGRGSCVIPNSVTSIGPSAFVNCTGLTNVTIPNSLTSIGDAAFSGCTSLTNVTIPNGVTGIGQQAFSGCTNLTSVTIGNSVTSMGITLYSGPFDGCTSLTNFSVDASNPAFSSLNGVLFDKAQTTLILFPPGRGGTAAPGHRADQPAPSPPLLAHELSRVQPAARLGHRWLSVMVEPSHVACLDGQQLHRHPASRDEPGILSPEAAMSG